MNSFHFFIVAGNRNGKPRKSSNVEKNTVEVTLEKFVDCQQLSQFAYIQFDVDFNRCQLQNSNNKSVKLDTKQHKEFRLF
jgi:hypothetical protein